MLEWENGAIYRTAIHSIAPAALTCSFMQRNLPCSETNHRIGGPYKSCARVQPPRRRHTTGRSANVIQLRLNRVSTTLSVHVSMYSQSDPNCRRTLHTLKLRQMSLARTRTRNSRLAFEIFCAPRRHRHSGATVFRWRHNTS